jgi:hypothetical protein
LLMMTALAVGVAGCATGTGTGGGQPQGKTPPGTPADPDDLTQRVQSLADRFIGREAQAYQDLEANSSNSNVRAWARTTKTGQALAAMSIATGPNPYENAVDLVVMITLKRASIEANEAQTLLSPQEGASLIELYRRGETLAWELVERILTPAEVQGVKDTITAFLREHADLRYTGFVRFTDLARDRSAAQRSAGGGNLLSLMFLDPLAGLDPATRELRQTRMLIGRAAYLAHRMPLVLQWQARIRWPPTCSNLPTRSAS